ncbi:hypothetical protein TSUD_312760 [Trifolium subterraneum]|uniref:Uncharacterized protein n=1 Tax=Trifolium subterraneum TaxID=3900 RepID=A0A2Z6NGA3_TRISU|nr:hypothetical protein TSUD_312760 [Trifolium subterraneum]
MGGIKDKGCRIMKVYRGRVSRLQHVSPVERQWLIAVHRIIPPQRRLVNCK